MDYRDLETKAGRIIIPALTTIQAAQLCVTWHWAASSYRVSKNLLKHYHFVLDKDGQAQAGVPVESNLREPGGAMPSGYAAHVKAANSNNIGISAAAMYGASETEARQGRYGPYPMTAAQIGGMVEVAAQLCMQYNIPVLPSRVLGHEEWDSVLGRTQDRWDLNCIPHLDFRPRVNPDGTYASTNHLRQLTAARVLELQQDSQPTLRNSQLEAFRRFVAFYDSAMAAQFPAGTMRLIRQLRDEPPLGIYARENLE